ncbi:MAG: ABC transporter permease subunit [Acetobacteraceae bacterium]|nr:ABC transporter permease subunit [Acetobacteraceae bacterium]
MRASGAQAGHAILRDLLGNRPRVLNFLTPTPTAVAIFLTQDFLPPRLALVFRTIIDMLAAIPSVVFGLWGIFIVIPAIRPIANWLYDTSGWIPFFSSSLSGPGLLPAALVLAIIILPTVAAISQDALNLVPYRTKEAAYGMGATRWEAILKVMVPTAAGGIASAMVLGFGRALGRDDGAHHADRQLEPDQPVAVRAGANLGVGENADRTEPVDCRSLRGRRLPDRHLQLASALPRIS